MSPESHSPDPQQNSLPPEELQRHLEARERIHTSVSAVDSEIAVSGVVHQVVDPFDVHDYVARTFPGSAENYFATLEDPSRYYVDDRRSLDGAMSSARAHPEGPLTLSPVGSLTAEQQELRESLEEELYATGRDMRVRRSVENNFSATDQTVKPEAKRVPESLLYAHGYSAEKVALGKHVVVNDEGDMLFGIAEGISMFKDRATKKYKAAEDSERGAAAFADAFTAGVHEVNETAPEHFNSRTAPALMNILMESGRAAVAEAFDKQKELAREDRIHNRNAALGRPGFDTIPDTERNQDPENYSSSATMVKVFQEGDKSYAAYAHIGTTNLYKINKEGNLVLMTSPSGSYLNQAGNVRIYQRKVFELDEGDRLILTSKDVVLDPSSLNRHRNPMGYLPDENVQEVNAHIHDQIAKALLNENGQELANDLVRLTSERFAATQKIEREKAPKSKSDKHGHGSAAKPTTEHDFAVVVVDIDKDLLPQFDDRPFPISSTSRGKAGRGDVGLDIMDGDEDDVATLTKRQRIAQKMRPAGSFMRELMNASLDSAEDLAGATTKVAKKTRERAGDYQLRHEKVLGGLALQKAIATRMAQQELRRRMTPARPRTQRRRPRTLSRQ